MMKIKPNNLPQITLIVIGIILSCAIIIPSKLQLSALWYGLLLASLSSLIIGLWKVESFEMTNHVIKKVNMAGLITRSWDLRQIFTLEKKNIDADHPNNLLSFLKLISSNPRFFRYRIAIVKFDNGKNLRISEMGMSQGEFNKIYKAIMKFEKSNRN